MKISLLTIGDELLIGQILNSNAQWMSDQLTGLGVSVVRHLTVGDVESEIVTGLDFLLPISDAIIIGGGLGPTHDDITMEVLSRYFHSPLEYDAEWVSIVEAYFKSRGRVMSESNKKQGFLLKNAHRIDNDCGTAAGQHLTIPSGKQIFAVPGVPHEVKSFMKRYILPELSKTVQAEGVHILKQTLLTTGIGESALAERCDPFVQKIKHISGITLAFLPSSTVVRLRLQWSAKSATEEKQFMELVEELKTFCGKDFFGFEPHTLEEDLVHTLRDRKETLALAESCTGGYLAHQITQVPGSSQVFLGSVVCYHAGIKTSELQVQPSLIEKEGVVSEAVAKNMAEGIRKKWNSTYAIGITGYLGTEGGDTFARAGTVWIALATPTEIIARRFQFEADRGRGKERAAQAALDLLRRHLARMRVEIINPFRIVSKRSFRNP